MPDLAGLIKDMQAAREAQATAQAQQAVNPADLISQLPPELQQQFAGLSPEEQAAVLQQAAAGGAQI